MEGNLLTSTVDLAMHVTLSYIKEGDFAVDATCGNGHDTLRLAEAVGSSGQVLAVDLQPRAIETSRTLAEGAGARNITFVCGNFLQLREHILLCGEHQAAEKLQPSAVLFNLGYLPGGDKQVTTRAEDTVKAVSLALDLIKTGGIVSVVLYPGHPEGARERAALLEFAETLSAGRYHTVYADLPNQKNNPPQILWITKKK